LTVRTGRGISKAKVEALKKSLNPFELFVAQYLSQHLKYPVPRFHRQLYKAAYECAVLHLYNELLIIAPRYFAKSYIYSFFLPLFLMCTENLDQIIAFSRDRDLAKKFLRLVKTEIENNILIQADFGLRPGEEWSKEQISYVRKDGFRGEFASKSKGMSPRGWHPDLAIIDDPQKVQDAQSETVRENDWEWFSKDFAGMMQKNPVIFVGTNVHPLCLASKTYQNPAWTTLKFAALDDNGNSIWPEKMNNEDLAREREKWGDDAFRSEYMNDPKINDNPIFRRDEFRYYNSNSVEFAEIARKGLYTVTFVDPAISKHDTADYTAIITVSATLDKVPNVYIRECKRGHWSMPEAVNEAFATYERFHQRKTIVESNAYQLALYQQIQAEQEIRGRRINPYSVKQDRDKVRRAQSITRFFQEGRVYFAEDDPAQEGLKDELILFPTGDHDDRVDALVGCLQDIQETSLGREQHTGPIIVRADRRQLSGPIIIRAHERRQEVKTAW